LVQIVATVWERIEDSLKDLKTIRVLVGVFDDDTLLALQSHFPHPSISSIASRLPPAALSTFARRVIDTVCEPTHALEVGQLSPGQITLLPCIFAWEGDYSKVFLELLLENLKIGSNAHKAHTLKTIQAILAADDHRWLRPAFLEAVVQEKRQLIEALRAMRVEAETWLVGKEEEAEVKKGVAIDSLVVWLKLLMHIAHSSPDSGVQPMREAFLEMIAWVEERAMVILRENTRSDELDLEVEDKAPRKIGFALRLVSALLIVFNDYDTLLPYDAAQEAEASAVETFHHRLWKLIESSLKVRSDSEFLKIATNVGWKTLLRSESPLMEEDGGERGRSLASSAADSRSSFALLIVLRDASANKKVSIAALRWLVKSNAEFVEICMDHVWRSLEAQLPPDDYAFELYLEDTLPAEIEALISAFSGTTQMVQNMAVWTRRRLEHEHHSHASVWTTLQLIALSVRPIKRIHVVNVNPLKTIATQLLESMREADETEATLRSRFDQLLKSPGFSNTTSNGRKSASKKQ